MENLKFYFIIFLLSVCIIVLGYKWYQNNSELEIAHQSKQKIKDQILTGAKEIKRTVLRNGAENLLLDITGHRTSIGNAEQTDIPDIVDTAAMALDIRTKQLIEVTAIVAQYKAENLQLKAQLDSNKNLFYTYKQNGLELKFTPPYSSSNYATADFLGRFNITAAQGYQRKGLLGRKKTLLSITSDSPFFIIDKVNYVGFNKEPINFDLELQASASFNQMTGVGVGPGIKMEIGRFDFRGNYQYYQQERAWMYGANVTYKVFGF